MYYIGLHSTDDLNDGYFGSGQRLAKSIAYHGKSQHTKRIIEFLPTRKAVKEKEAQLVNEATLKDPFCMNLCKGGQGGDFSDETRKRIAETKRGKTLSEEHKKKVSTALKGKKKPPGFGERVSKSLTGKPLSETHKAACSAGHLGKKLSSRHRQSISEQLQGRSRSEDTKRKISKFMKGKSNVSAAKLCKPCTVDGQTIYPSRAALTAALGYGKNGARSPHLRFV
mgnify:CR=1 FL=1